MAELREDYDFIGFTFNGKHSIRDLHIYRTSDGSRYNFDLAPQMSDKIVDVPGGDGTYYFGTNHKQRQFSVSFAFDELYEEEYRDLRQLFAGKNIAELSFDEYPYKVYSAKVTGTPQLKTICFDAKDKTTGEKVRVYKGEGSVQFTCYWPYAHTPTHINQDGNLIRIDGRFLSEYGDLFPNKNQWAAVSNLPDENNSEIINPGDVPAPFVVNKESIAAKTAISVGGCSIKVLEDCTDLTWDSKSGLVTGTVNGKTRAIRYQGNSIGAIPVTSTPLTLINLDFDNVTYQYWYY